MMHVRVLPFGVLKDWLGASASTVELPEGATVAALLERINAGKPEARQASILRGIAVSVNAEYAPANHPLRDGDEVGLLPPVSGGAGPASDPAPDADAGSITLTREIIDAHALVAASKRGEDGAVLVFDGIVRNHTRNRETLYLDYEAYEEMALKQMHELADQARQRFGVRHVTIVHRLGRLHVGETSVLIVVASAHRAHAYEASRWLIDTLKTTVPIWKKETFVDGAAWTDGEPFPEGLVVTPPETNRET
jgi:molybdopterin synthase catalytic subunit/molybdopterin converting factor small subunit